MTTVKQKLAAEKFAKDWEGKGYERGQSQTFWLMLLNKVFGVPDPDKFISFEDKVVLDHTSFIDGRIHETQVLIEQKSRDKNLKSPIRQSDGSMLTPFEQAKRYIINLPRSEHPRWVVLCNFQEFHIYDMEHPEIKEPEVVLLKNLGKEYSRLQFLVDSENDRIRKEEEVSLQAGEIVGKIYDALLKQYHNPKDPHSLKSLNMLCVRIVFCLYAEDAGIFPYASQFNDYLRGCRVEDVRQALLDLFKVLDTEIEERSPYLKDSLKEFPYVNGGLFTDEDIEIPMFTEEIVDLLVKHASTDFDWSGISPTIFGAVFESTLNQETRRSNGMHYTSIENIHKVIDPLFLDGLRERVERIRNVSNKASRNKQYAVFLRDLGELRFLDPACGSGNFLTETYLSLRRLENEILKEMFAGQMVFDVDGVINVHIDQFYGIELNDFAVDVAKTALWIAEFQMMKETEKIVQMDLDFLPLKSYTNIIEGNALRMDWNEVVSSNTLSYIMGNPPFVGKKEQDKSQKSDLLTVYGKGISGVGNMDYVTAWYVKAADYMKDTTISTAFVSTNSITQGEQPPVLWKKLIQFGVTITFAHRSFDWSSESSDEAAVYCVIIGFTVNPTSKDKRIYSDNQYVAVTNINPYLLDAPTTIISSRAKPLCDVPTMCYGSMPIDNNHLILNEQEMLEVLKESPNNSMFIKSYVGGDELLNGKKRWCLWLYEVDPALYVNSKFIMNRINATENYRRNESDRAQTNKAADTPHLFGEIRQPKNGALVVPKVSSEDRPYIPISYVEPGIIINGSALMIPDASLYHFGILSSNVHNSWMRVVAGRLEMRYQYSANIVYNNFPWPDATDAQKKKIEEAAQEVLDARKNHPTFTLAKMYKRENFRVLSDLKTAHDHLNRAVMRAYGFEEALSETDCVAELMKMYQIIVSKGK